MTIARGLEMTEGTQGRKAREPLGAEFWSPKDAGETIAGRISQIGTGHFGKFAELSPVLVFGGRVKPGRFGSLRVGLNSWLDKLVGPADVGKLVIVTYRGKRPTPAGNMRTFDVYDSEAAELREYAARIERGESPEVPAPTGHDPRDDERRAKDIEDELPF